MTPLQTTDSTIPPDPAETPATRAGGGLLPYSFAKRHGVVISQTAAEHVHVMYRNGVEAEILSEVRRYAGLPLVLEKVTNDRFDATLAMLYEGKSGEAMQMMEDLGQELDLDQVVMELHEPEDLLEAEDDAPIIRLINALLSEAIKKGASDVHIEPFETRLVVRFRIDGVLHEILQPRPELAPLIVSRIKVMSRLDIAEKRLPQDGRISLRIAGRAVDVRVSTIPSGRSERVVLRLLDKQAGRLDLEQLGLEKSALAVAKDLIRRPHGIILVTGPTGSGKTTTLYAILGQLNDQTRNVMTVEDPIEYYIDGIGQMQVNTKVDMNFARGLRAILRQDPDVVMVGEIRDLETAQIAVQASLTGHLVLSTLHTNTAVGAVTRLRDMGVEPFLLSSSLLGVLAQRLVRILCKECRHPYQASEADCAILEVSTDSMPTIYEAAGCEACNHIGYLGRMGLFELIAVDETMRAMIHDEASEHEMEVYARKQSLGIRKDAIRRVLEGATTIEEMLRVTRSD